MLKTKMPSAIRKRKRNSLIFKIAVIIFVVAIGVQIVSLQSQISDKKQEAAALQQQLDAQVEENQEMQAQLDAGVNDDYIQKVAREDLGYVSPFERVFVDIAEE